VEAPPKFEDLGIIESGKGYRIRKLRYEIVPGFQSTAILYEPENLSGKIPAILNPNGHELQLGKAAEYKQKRCINFAKRGILALSLEWLYCGELNVPENKHEFAAHLDLVGANGVGLFYLAMRKGLDYLYQHANVDRARLGVAAARLDRVDGVARRVAVLALLDRQAPGVLVQHEPHQLDAGQDRAAEKGAARSRRTTQQLVPRNLWLRTDDFISTLDPIFRPADLREKKQSNAYPEMIVYPGGTGCLDIFKRCFKGDCAPW